MLPSTALPSLALATIPNSAGKKELSWEEMDKMRPEISSSGVQHIQDDRYAIEMNVEFQINGQKEIKKEIFNLKLIGKGDYHIVYEFTDQGKFIKIGNEMLPVDELVIRHASPQAQRNDARRGGGGVTRKHVEEDLREYFGDFKAFVYLKKLCENEEIIRIPQVYMWPKCPRIRTGNPVERTAEKQIERLYDTANGNFWLIRKIPFKVDTMGWAHGETMDQLKKDPKQMNLLNHVKKVMTHKAKLGHEKEIEYMHDYYSKNVMLGKDGLFYLVDFSGTQDDDWDLALKEEVEAWAHDNREVLNYLIADFPVEVVKARFEPQSPVSDSSSSDLSSAGPESSSNGSSSEGEELDPLKPNFKIFD
jgi:hypothetical protein